MAFFSARPSRMWRSIKWAAALNSSGSRIGGAQVIWFLDCGAPQHHALHQSTRLGWNEEIPCFPVYLAALGGRLLRTEETVLPLLSGPPQACCALCESHDIDITGIPISG